jgi:hypothetical protein
MAKNQFKECKANPFKLKRRVAQLMLSKAYAATR